MAELAPVASLPGGKNYVSSNDAPLTIAVLVKYVPDAQFDRHLDSTTGRVNRSESILSELDEYPLEAALQIAEARGGAKAGNRVVAITVGGDDASAALKKALQIGAYEAIHVNDPAIIGSDVSGTALILAAAVRTLGSVDLVLTGMASTDGETSLVPAQVAAHLNIAQLGFARSVAVEGAEVVGERNAHGSLERIRCALPALAAVTDQANEPRFPKFKEIMAARKRPVTTLSLSELGIAAEQVGVAGAKTEIISAAPRPGRTSGTVITDTGDAGVKLVDFLADSKLL